MSDANGSIQQPGVNGLGVLNQLIDSRRPPPPPPLLLLLLLIIVVVVVIVVVDGKKYDEMKRGCRFDNTVADAKYRRNRRLVSDVNVIDPPVRLLFRPLG